MQRRSVERHQYQTTSIWDVPSDSRPGHTWRIEFVANEAGAHAYCECPAAQHGRRCKHVAAVELAELGEPVVELTRTAAVRWSNDDLWGPR